MPQALAPGSALRRGLRAEEILLAVGPPGQISARNVFEATVDGIDEDGDRALVSLGTSGERLVAKLTVDAAPISGSYRAPAYTPS